jgi:hypothetical protein
MANVNPSVMTTGKVRLSFVNIFTPKAFQEGGEEKYSVTILIPKTDTATVDKLKAAINAAKAKATTEKWGGSVPKIFDDKFAGTTVRDADNDKDQEGEVIVAKHPEAKGCYMMHVASKNQPGVVDANMTAITDSKKVYSGCYGRVNITFFGYNNAGKKGVSAGLNHVQFIEDGEPLGSSVRVEDAFAD